MVPVLEVQPALVHSIAASYRVDGSLIEDEGGGVDSKMPRALGP